MDDEIPIYIYLLVEEDERRNQMRLYHRNLRDNQNPFEVFSDRNFKRTFRYSKELAQFLIDRLEPHLVGVRSSAIPAYLKVLATLNFLGHGSYQHVVGLSSVTALSQSSISRAISTVCELITVQLMPDWLKFPTTAEEQEETKQGFLTKFGFRGVVGCIDGTHVAIVAPPVTDLDHPPHLYINRKGYHSVNVMLICNADCSIIACDARYPGCVHDSAIWRTSDIRNHLRNQHENGGRSRLIGDSGYGLEPWLFTPFARVVPGTAEANFNNLLTSTRNCIERTNGILKGRFRCLLKHRVLHYTPDKSAYIIYAATVLHNIAIWARLEDDDDDEIFIEDVPDEEEIHPQEMQDNHLLQRGREARADYIRLYLE